MAATPKVDPEVTPVQVEPNAGGAGCFEIILFVVFGWGLLLNFAKTADLMAAFAPSNIAGYEGMETFYGLAVAVLVEGLLLVMKGKALFVKSKSALEWAWDVILTLFPFVISALAQPFDSFMVRDTLSQQPAEIQMILNWGVPAIPSLVLLGIMVWGFIHSAPAGLFKGIAVRRDNDHTSVPVSWRIGEFFNNLFGGWNKQNPQ